MKPNRTRVVCTVLILVVVFLLTVIKFLYRPVDNSREAAIDALNKPDPAWVEKLNKITPATTQPPEAVLLPGTRIRILQSSPEISSQPGDAEQGNAKGDRAKQPRKEDANEMSR